MLGTREAPFDHQGRHDQWSMVPARRATSKPASARSRPRSKSPPPTTTRRNCRSVWRSSPAVLRSSRSVVPRKIEVKERKDRVDDALNATQCGCRGRYRSWRRRRSASCLQVHRRGRATIEDQEAGVNIVRRALQTPVRQIAENAGVEGSIVVGKIFDENKANYGYDAQSGQIWRSGQGRHH